MNTTDLTGIYKEVYDIMETDTESEEYGRRMQSLIILPRSANPTTRRMTRLRTSGVQ